MKLIYRGVKYSSNNSTALKIVEKHKHEIGRLIDSKKFYKAIVSYKFPLYQYLKQLFTDDSTFIREPQLFWKTYLTKYLEKCWQSSETKILDACWKVTIEQEQKAIANSLPKKLKYRGITYYK